MQPMKDLKKAKIEPVHIREAEVLCALFKRHKAENPGVTQAKFGEENNIGNQGVVWQYLHARIPLNKEAAVKFASGLGCRVEEFSPRLAKELEEFQVIALSSAFSMDKIRHSSNIKHSSDVTNSPEYHFFGKVQRVPLITWTSILMFTAQGASGADVIDYVPVVQNGNGSLFAVRVSGDSMASPHGRSYPDGSIVIVDIDNKLPTSGQRIIALIDGQEVPTFKELVEEDGRRWLKPLNPQHPPIHGAFQVLGVVTGRYEPE